MANQSNVVARASVDMTSYAILGVLALFDVYSFSA